MKRVYKILTRAEWEHAAAAGRFEGSAVDLKDGFIHLSGESQWAQTLSLHFAGQSDLLLAAFDAASLGAALKWERSRGGELFPHLYAALPCELAVSVDPVTAKAEGAA